MRPLYLMILSSVVALAACEREADAPAPDDAPPTKDSSEARALARAVAAAKAAGVAPVARGSDVIGPFMGDDGSLSYTDGEGRVSTFDPSSQELTFALRNPPRVTFKLTPQGAYVMDGGVLEPIAKVPDEAMKYPHVDALMARVIAAASARVEAQREARERVVPAALPASWLSGAPTTDSVGAKECEEHFVDGFYVGCY